MERPGSPSRIFTLLALGVSVAWLLGTAPSALGAERPPERQVVLVVAPSLSFGDALADPSLRRLAGSEGIGLLTTSGGADLPARTAIGIGAGRPLPEMPAAPLRIRSEGTGLRVIPPTAIRGVEPGLLASTLSGSGLTVAYVDLDPAPGTTVAPLVAMDRGGSIPLVARTEEAAQGALAVADLVIGDDLALVPLALARTPAREVLVVVAGAGASEEMRARGETVDALVLAHGAPETLLGAGGTPRGLTSDTTRRAGVVAEVDLAPSVLAFLGAAVPDRMVGSPVRIEGDLPTGLHARYLELQRVVGPAGLSALAFGLLVFAVALALAFGRVRPSTRARADRLAADAMVLAVALLVAMLPASWLPSFGPLSVGLTLAGASLAITAVALVRGRGDVRVAVATVAVIGLALVVADAAMGWPSELTPMLGGGVLDGERFFGLGNAYAGIVVAGALLAAARLRPRRGLLLLVLAAALAGLPSVGADLGGCLTLAAATALWVGLPRWKLGPRTWALVAVALATAGAYVAITGRLLGGGTHLSRPTIADGLLVAFVARLLENVRTTSATPAAWLLVFGLAAWFALIRRPPAVLRPVLEADVRWWNALLALTISGLIGWVLNDTYGLAGSAFAFTSAAVLAPALRGHTGATG